MAEPAAKKSKVVEPSDGRQRHTVLRELGTTGLRTTQMGLGGASLGDLFVKIPNSQVCSQFSNQLGLYKEFTISVRCVGRLGGASC
jgi:hypothetical protein